MFLAVIIKKYTSDTTDNIYMYLSHKIIFPILCAFSHGVIYSILHDYISLLCKSRTVQLVSRPTKGISFKNCLRYYLFHI